MTLKDSLDRVFQQLMGADIFHGHGIDNAWDEAVALVFYVLDLPIDSDEHVLENNVTQTQWQQIQALVKQRIKERIPVAYLTHQAWFMGLPFYVDQRVLIPRSPFGEWIEKRFVPWLDPQKVKRILDIGTGSGCMAIAASYQFPKAHVDAVDSSLDALAVAKHNVHKHRVADKVQLIHSDCFKALNAQHQYDLIISNPPYVSQEEIDDLPAEYSYEPAKTALYAPHDGMAVVDKILQEAKHYMTEHAILVVEVGYSDEVLMARYPYIPFTWLDCEFGGQGLCLLTREQLEKCDVRQ